MAFGKIISADNRGRKKNSQEANSSISSEGQGLKFRFDVSTFRLLGRELITDRITALFELVKNSYDANADNVSVEFYNVNKVSLNSKIIIRDDGLGMSYTDIKNKWMVIGTNSKRSSRLSPAPYFRKVVGQKGVGRFAVDKLGSTMTLTTKRADSPQITTLETDWKEYEKLSKQLDLFDPSNEELSANRKFFTDIENRYWVEKRNDDSHGTTIEITSIRDPWTELDIERAYKELAKLVSPINKLNHPFSIRIKSNEYENFKDLEVLSKAINHATEEITVKFDSENKLQESLKYEKGELKLITTPYKKMGPVYLKLYYFDKKAKDIYKKEYQGGNIDGLKIYRDGVITTPFAEYEAQDIKKRDILGIDKRRYSGFFDKVSSSDLLGFIEISETNNPSIIDSTNRQDFVDNEEYRELKSFIIEQLDELEKYLKGEKDREKRQTESNLKDARDKLKVFTSIVRDLRNTSPSDLHGQFDALEQQSIQIKAYVERGIKQYIDIDKKLTRQENLFLSLMSLQDYALEIAHVVRTSLGKIAGIASYLYRRLPETDLNEEFRGAAKQVYDEMQSLDSVVSFLLSYAKSNTDFKEFDMKVLIEKAFDMHKHIFEKENIKSIVEINSSLLITHNEKFVEDIIENLISNSVKAVKNNDGEKIIKCTGLVEENQFIIYFSDNGYGIKEEDKNRIFNIYHTSTAEQGGAGIGLYVVKTRIESMKGSVEVIENEFKPTGATFKIELPFNKYGIKNE
ncbi:sensor histidine kinase [Adhaeribacter soli]|uniref:histidine kinase n=1 Tax=Adhaeribacter soli TaxID=2607655 RepID=A0A5N1IIQ2_9BACT|nr:sensor histidine kinase [Adhaeribacter soli]KAA9325169.1 GHKL domain-containing protein [Adhaeribacter soli]